MRKYFTSILLLLTSVCGFAQEVEEEEEQRPAIVDSMYQLRLGLDLSRIYFNQVQKKFEQRTSYELELDFYWRGDLYFVLDGGFGNSSLSYGDLTYNSNNVFFRAGFNKSLLPRYHQHVWQIKIITKGCISCNPLLITLTLRFQYFRFRLEMGNIGNPLLLQRCSCFCYHGIIEIKHKNNYTINTISIVITYITK